MKELVGGLGRLRRVQFGGRVGIAVPLPTDGAIQSIATDRRRPGVIFPLESWTRSRLWYQYTPGQRQPSDTRLLEPAKVDVSRYESVEVEVPSHDGVRVPLSIVYRKDLKRDGSHPLLLDGYGSYGITLDPSFSSLRVAWLERGGIFATAHVRGGGEYGEGWHQAGQKATKPNTWKDFIACAEYLVKQGYTSPEHLAGTGTSAGGILIGRAITERPDLFRAAVPRVGVINALRTEHEPGGPANIPEFGTTTRKEEFNALREMDATEHVQAGVRYPAVLLDGGDQRFPGRAVAAGEDGGGAAGAEALPAVRCCSGSPSTRGTAWGSPRRSGRTRRPTSTASCSGSWGPRPSRRRRSAVLRSRRFLLSHPDGRRSGLRRPGRHPPRRLQSPPVKPAIPP